MVLNCANDGVRRGDGRAAASATHLQASRTEMSGCGVCATSREFGQRGVGLAEMQAAEGKTADEGCFRLRGMNDAELTFL